MKAFFNYLSTVSLLLGAIIGAGFLSGAEPVDFFGTDNILLSVFLGVLIMSVVFAVCFYFIKERQKSNFSNMKLFGSEKAYKIAILITAYVFTASMLAGVDALWNTFGFLKGVPLLSTATIVLISTFSVYGVKGLEKLNLMLMPMIVIGVNILIFSRFELDFGSIKSISFCNVLSVITYVFLNFFVALPVMRDCSKDKSKKTLIFSAVTVALLIGGELFVLLCALNGDHYDSYEMPLLYAINVGGFSATYFFSLLFGSITSAFSAYYPVYNFAKRKGGKFGLAVSGFAVMILSRLGLDKIVKYLYPLIAVFGLAYFIGLIVGIKNTVNADNIDIQNRKRRTLCQERKRIKTRLSN